MLATTLVPDLFLLCVEALMPEAVNSFLFYLCTRPAGNESVALDQSGNAANGTTSYTSTRLATGGVTDTDGGVNGNEAGLRDQFLATQSFGLGRCNNKFFLSLTN